jgi:hypothetical protein
MKLNRTLSAIVGLGLTVLLAQAGPVAAAEIKIWTARALATVLADVGPQFERATGHKLGSDPKVRSGPWRPNLPRNTDARKSSARRLAGTLQRTQADTAFFTGP